MNVLAGLLAFTVGLGLFVFPGGVAGEVTDLLGRDAGHWATVAVRTLGVLAMVGGFGLVVW